ncbi:MAG: bifunctional folylpolyglutamate synthase/dihydrofolate synthase, partial [Candidatus Zixiibacteriota bacterium]
MTSASAYRAAERYIRSREFFGMKLGLDNITGFLDSIGNPQQQYPTVHISGTNGKGSTVAMLATVLQQAGYKTGQFTSPHLVDLKERIRVDGRKVRTSSVTAFVRKHRKELTRRKLSFFEVVTAMALDYFARAGVDIAVVETGLGGRLDATNVLNPTLTITTEISLDHVEILGRSVRKIANEKAGIIKAGVPHLVGLLSADAARVFSKVCSERQAPLHSLKTEETVVHDDARRFDFKCNGFSLRAIAPTLYGSHQIHNAALVTKASMLLNEQGFSIPAKAVKNGIGATRWPGRFQIVRRRNHPTMIFDVAHNTGCVGAFVESFCRMYPDRKAVVLTGFVQRKEHQLMFDVLSSITSE